MKWIPDETKPQKPALRANGKPYSVIIPAGTRLGRRLRKGERRENARIITKENAREMAKRSGDIRAEAAARGMVSGVNKALKRYDEKGELVLPVGTPLQAWEALTEKFVEKFMTSGSLKSMSDALLVAGKVTGMYEEKTEQSSTSPVLAGLEDAQVLLQVFNFYDNHRPELADVIDAETVP